MPRSLGFVLVLWLVLWLFHVGVVPRGDEALGRLLVRFVVVCRHAREEAPIADVFHLDRHVASYFDSLLSARIVSVVSPTNGLSAESLNSAVTVSISHS